MRCFVELLAVLGLSIASASTPSTREVPVYEATIAPGVTHDYILCESSDISSFTRSISAATSECEAETSFSWSGDSLPTTRQRNELCNCTSLIEKLQSVDVPRCSVSKDDKMISYAAFFTYSFYVCTTATPVKTTAPLSTPSAQDTSKSTTKSSSSSQAPLIGGVVGGVVVCFLVAAFVIAKCRKKREPEPSGAVRRKGDAEPNEDDDYVLQATPLSPMTGHPMSGYIPVVASPKSQRTTDTNTTTNESSSSGRQSTGPGSEHSTRSVRRFRSPDSGMAPPKLAMWDDSVILAVRVPLDAVFFGPMIASGGFGEVYRGTYRGETVAIKQLLPARRKDLTQIDDFLGEVKLMASLDHERIVRFIGVAWNSLSDVCAVVEYMENGDLRSVLTRWDHGDEMRPQGFDADKVKIALHIAHALTYLHSLQPVVVHRDLKSKNILLTASYDAKLTDFGISRERADSTMTAGVGSSLWMAPEVMMGERYNEKADVFSFGVVLSELDTQQLPYAQAKQAAPDQRLPDSAILQMVSLGRLRVSFSDRADADLVELAYDCVQVDPTKRPTTAEVLHRVHQARRRVL